MLKHKLPLLYLCYLFLLFCKSKEKLIDIASKSDNFDIVIVGRTISLQEAMNERKLSHCCSNILGAPILFSPNVSSICFVWELINHKHLFPLLLNTKTDNFCTMLLMFFSLILLCWGSTERTKTISYQRLHILSLQKIMPFYMFIKSTKCKIHCPCLISDLNFIKMYYPIDSILYVLLYLYKISPFSSISNWIIKIQKSGLCKNFLNIN